MPSLGCPFIGHPLNCSACLRLNCACDPPPKFIGSFQLYYDVGLSPNVTSCLLCCHCFALLAASVKILVKYVASRQSKSKTLRWILPSASPRIMSPAFIPTLKSASHAVIGGHLIRISSNAFR